MKTSIFRAFGVEVELQVPLDDFSEADSHWRLNHIYTPYIATTRRTQFTNVLDIGASFGAFCIPFALAFPEVNVIAFEPQTSLFELLQKNIELAGITNISAYNCALISEGNFIEHGAPLASPTVLTAANANSPLPVLMLAGTAFLERHRDKPAFATLSTSAECSRNELFETQQMPVALCSSLADCDLSLIKIIAPEQENSLLSELVTSPKTMVLGEAWSVVDSRVLYHSTGEASRGYLSLAGTELALRPVASNSRREGLDIVVAAYNAQAYLQECVTSLLVDGRPEIRVIVVDDGSTDGSCDELAQAFAHDPRIRVEKKLNGGCASARNFGRMLSDATHVAFVDADDRVSPGFFADLLELSRYSGAEITQGGFNFLTSDEHGEASYHPSYEEQLYVNHPRFDFGPHRYIRIHRDQALTGQPTIWRRVYRRDFLDAKELFFPEHIRAFDDQYFQLASVFHAGEIYTRLDIHYHYRQHPAQDIKQFDERHFYELEMFRLILKKSLQEGWNNIAPILRSFVNTINWSLKNLRRDLMADFLKGAAELWVYFLKSLHMRPLQEELQTQVEHPDFVHYVRQFEERLRGRHDAFSWVYLDSIRFHPSTMAMNRALIQRQIQPG